MAAKRYSDSVPSLRGATSDTVVRELPKPVGVLEREPPSRSDCRLMRDGTGLDRRDELGVPAGLPRPLKEPAKLLVRPTDTGVAVPLPGIGPMTALACFTPKTRAHNQPSHVASYASRSRSSRFRSNALRYRSYDSRNERSTRDENISSPRGLLDGGIGEIGTDELRLDMRMGEGARRRLTSGVVGDEGREGDGEVRGKRNENGLKGNFERRGGCLTFKYIFRFRRAWFACGTYLKVAGRPEQHSLETPVYSLIGVPDLLRVHAAQEEQCQCCY